MKKNKITYYYDALCGWCFGFSSVMDQIYSKYKDNIEFEVISGGLFTGGRVGLINDVASYIKAGAFRSVEERTGVKFGDRFLNEALENNSMLLDSLPPSIALCIVKEGYPDKGTEYASKLLKTFYIDGTSADDIDRFADLAVEMGEDRNEFLSKMQNEKYRKMALNEFDLSKSGGVGGFPSLVLKTENNEMVIAKGYTDFDPLDEFLSQLIS